MVLIVKRILIAITILLTIGLTQAVEANPDGIKYSNPREAINNVAATIGMFCAVQEVVSMAAVPVLGYFLPNKASVKFYVKLPRGKRVNITKQVLAIKDAACPALIGITNGFR